MGLYRFLTRRKTIAMWSKPRRSWLDEWKGCQLVTRQGVWHFAAKSRWGVSVWSYTDAEGVRLSHPWATWYGDLTKMKRKNAPGVASNQKHLAAIESNVFAKLHGIVAHCCVTQYDDGEPRKPGWITLKTFGSAWQVEAKDPDSCCRIAVVESKLDEALALMSLLLESEEAPWEPDTWLQQQAAKNRKK